MVTVFILPAAASAAAAVTGDVVDSFPDRKRKKRDTRLLETEHETTIISLSFVPVDSIFAAAQAVPLPAAGRVI